MPSAPDQPTIAELTAENARLRRLAELIHDHFSPADGERFPQHGEEICAVFFMDAAEQDAYWHQEACRALGLPVSASDSWRNEIMPKRDALFRVGTLVRTAQ